MNTLVLDAMGVIYSAGDDVRELLCPFLLEKGGTNDSSRIGVIYDAASLDAIRSSELWEAVGLEPSIEDEYLERYQLTDGLIDFLVTVKSQGYELWCLSNDLSEWSRKLRTSFGLDTYFEGFVISGNVGSRKPDPAIYRYLIDQVNANPSDMIFVDDRVENLEMALKLGLNTILFSPTGHQLTSDKYQVVTTFSDLLLLL
ncbi:HAD family hydrolase [Chloroflexota bacterium]